MAKSYQIGALWIEGRLSFLEQLCLKSYVDAGHHTILYHYGEVTGVPDGVEMRDANEVLPQTGFLTHERTGSPALHSDLFRYKMLEKGDRIIWADTDAYCVKPFKTKTGHFFGWESKRHVNGGVLGLPKDSEALGRLLEFTSDEFAIPPWLPEEVQADYRAAAERGAPVHAGEMKWGVWGPHAVSHFLAETGEIKYAFPQAGLYPFTFKERRLMLRPDYDAARKVTDETYSIHFYGRRMRKRIVEAEGGAPDPASLMGKLLKKHDIDPAAAPIPAGPAPVTPTPASKAAKAPAADPTAKAKDAAPVGKPGMNTLTVLADESGSDKGSVKHRYTELYHMLFNPFRGRKITFLEMGLMSGGPEHGIDADRKTSAVPSIQMWLNYFPKANIIGLDVSDFSAFETDRFTFHRCDMDDRANIAKAAADMPALDIILDDASHASKHQQDGFLELFPKLKSGGMFIFEDLRWQPEEYEAKTPGITKTADLLQSFVKNREFTHSDPAVAAEFNALRPMISGCFVFQAHFTKHRRDQVAVIHKL
ncbi:MAG: hypothetical protein ACPGFA_06310 [Pikeienuella sp.]